jgi:hypothetical protein
MMEKKSTEEVLNSIPVTQEQINEAYNEFVLKINKNTPRYVNSQQNANALREYIEKTSGALSLQFAGAWSEAWLYASAEGLLEEPLTEKQKEARRLERIAEYTARDKRDGLNPHKSDAEIEAERQAAIDEHNKNVEAGKKRLEAARQAALNKPADPTPADVLADLRSQPFERPHIVRWLKTWASVDPALIRTVRKAHPDLAARIDAVTAGRPDPGAA